MKLITNFKQHCMESTGDLFSDKLIKYYITLYFHKAQKTSVVCTLSRHDKS